MIDLKSVDFRKFREGTYKDLERDERELIKEQLREEKLLEKERAEKRITKLQYDYNKLCSKSKKDIVKMHEIETELEKLNLTVKQNNYALTHNRAGYVYVVSNSDMKDGQYKIGITRRTVEERMKELGSGASHSFPMNVHGYVYSEDCFELESALHKYFDKQRVNQCNPRKEWFKTTLDEISRAFWSVGGKWWCGYPRGFKNDNVTPRDIVNETIRNLIKQVPNLKDIEFFHDDYIDYGTGIRDYVVYCDIPYRNSTKYATKNFDYEKFYGWCKYMSQHNIVLISEYWMPDDFECIWQKQLKCTLDKNNCSDKTEKLFIYRGDYAVSRR